MMWPVPLWPDVEAWASSWIAAQLGTLPRWQTTSVYIDNAVPREGERPPVMVIITRDGGISDPRSFDYPRVRFQVWAPDMATANQLTADLRAFISIANTDTSTPVRAVTMTGPARVPDDTTGERRVFWATFTIVQTQGD